MDNDDPISQFFPGEDDVDLYSVLGLEESATADEIKRAYRRLALLYHPDKHATASESAKKDASTKFQQVGFAYTVLSDEKRKARYDQTGKTDEGFDMAAGEDGWEAYFEQMFDTVTRGKLDEMKKSYQGSQEEIDDLKNAYAERKGDIGEIMTHIPHSTHEDEARFIVIISRLVKQGELDALPAWEKTSKDEKARLVRKKQGDKEAVEAENLAKELGVWDEFYGSGKTGTRKGKGKSKASSSQPEDEEGDVSALQALILKKREKNMNGFFDNLAAKYGADNSDTKLKRKGKKRSNEEEEDVDASPKKRSRKAPPPPDIDDAEFETLQERLFGNKAAATKPPSKTEKVKRSRKAK